MEYRTSIYSRRRMPLRPTYRKVTLLDLMRGERELERKRSQADKIKIEWLVGGAGIGLMYVPQSAYFYSTPGTER